MSSSTSMLTRLAIQLLLILLLTPIISSTLPYRVAPANHAALGIALGASSYLGASTTGSYQTNTGIVAFTLDGAQFVGGNTTAPLGWYNYERYYEFIASADHILTFTATAPSNPFGGSMTGVFNKMSVGVDDGDWQTANGTDTQLVVTQTIDLAHPSDGKPDQTITVWYYRPSWLGTEDPGTGYPDYYYGHSFSVIIREIPVLTMNSNVTGTITLPQPAGYQNYYADVSLTGHVDPPNTALTSEVLLDGVVWNYASNYGVYPDSNGDFTIPWSFDSATQYGEYGTSPVLYTFVVNYTGADDYATPEMLASSASVNLTVVISSSGVNTSPSTNNTEHLPIIIIPGVGGSELDNNLREVWPAPSGTSVSQVVAHLWQTVIKVDMGDLRLNSDGTGPADPNVHISAPDALQSGLSNFYGGLVSFLESKGYVLGQSLFLFPYDWRLNNAAHLDELDRLVNQARVANDSQQVILVAHSMGGLIATAYVNSDPARAAKINSIITMGTPFWGSPKVYYALTEGYALGNAFADLKQMKSMMQEWPAVYQLLPKIPFIKNSTTGDLLTLSDAFDVTFKAAYSDTPWQLNSGVLDKAYAFNALLGSPSSPNLPSGVRLCTIIGYATQTLNGYTVRTPTTDELAHNMTVEINGARVVLEPQFGDGDGTVPLWGAENTAATARYYVRTNPTPIFGDSAAHGDLPKNQRAQAILWSILDGNPLSPDDFDYVPRSKGTYAAEETDLIIHSDANLEILDQNGGMMGWNAYNGTVFEELPQGTFIDQDGIQYASIQNSSDPYTVLINGTDTGTFTFTVNVTRAGTTTAFSYPSIPVENGTVAQLSLNPPEISRTLPPLSVTTNGNTTSVSAKLISQTTTGGSQILPISSIIAEILMIVVAAASLIAIIVLRARRRHRGV